MKYVLKEEQGYVLFDPKHIVSYWRYPKYASKFDSIKDLLNTAYTRGFECEGRSAGMFGDCEIVILEDE